MAVEVEGRGQLQEFLGVLLARRWWVLVPAVLVFAFGASFAVVVPKKFVTRTQIEVRETTLPYSGSRSPSTSSQEVQNATYQIKSLARLDSVLRGLKWPQYLALSGMEQAEYRRRIQENIEVVVHQKAKGAASTFVSMVYADTDPNRAVEFLNALSTAWQEQVLERGKTKENAELDKLKETRSGLQTQLAEEELELARMKERYNISPTQPAPGSNQARGEDYVFERLARNETELEQLSQKETLLRVEVTGKKDLLARMPVEVTSDLTGTGSHAEEITRLEGEKRGLEDKRRGYGRAHSQYRLLGSAIGDIDRKIDELREEMLAGGVAGVRIPNPDRSVLMREIDAIDSELKVVEAGRQWLATAVADDRETARVLQSVYSEIRQGEDRIHQLRLLMEQANLGFQEKKLRVDHINSPAGDPFEITERVTKPNRPTEPDPLLITLFALFAGLGLGSSTALAIEYSGNAFRSVNDISRVMVVPVLGSVGAILTLAEGRRQQLSQAAVATCTAAVVLTLAFLTWAWVTQSTLLTPAMRTLIEQVRAPFL
jgi:capsular polysaccharide biosynthesis protein